MLSNEHKICVIVPVHTSTLSDTEAVSLKQCRKVLKSYSIYLVYPDSLNISKYLEIVPSLYLKPVTEQWLSTVENYNKMKRSLTFYNLFKEYDYMLTYELDSFIFSDNWNSARGFEYDYIGAPWFKDYTLAQKNANITGVGNSGFSLRNLKQCIFILNKIEKLKHLWKFITLIKVYKFFNLSFFLHLIDPIYKSNVKNNFYFQLFSKDHINEDLFWCLFIREIFDFKVASIEDAIAFSFEMYPSLLFEKNLHRLPIGCHAWMKYEPDFWRRYIDWPVNNPT